jgi:hypothetical protein
MLSGTARETPESLLGTKAALRKVTSLPSPPLPAARALFLFSLHVQILVLTFPKML